MSTLRTNEVEMLDGRGKGAITFDSVQEMKDSTVIKVGQKVRTLGYYEPGDGGGNDYEVVAASTGTDDGGSFIDLSGSGLQARGLFTSRVWAEQFGAVADYIIAAGTGTDNSPLIQNALNFSPTVFIGRGYFMLSGDGITIPPNGALIALGSSGYANITGDNSAWDTNLGVVLVPRDMSKSHTIDAMITECELSGGVLDNPAANESYATSSEGRLDKYRLVDFTNQNASGATAATPREFSVAVKLQRGSRMEGIFIRTTDESGAFVTGSSTTNHGNAPDIGVLAENAFFGQLVNCHLSWAFRMFAVAHLQYDSGDGYTPQGDRFLIDRSYLEGHCCLGIRHYDTVRVSGVSATEIRCKWFRSHRFSPTGSIRVGSDTFDYDSLTYDSGEDELVFSDLNEDPTGSVSVGDEMSRGEDNPNFGIGGTTVNNSFLRSMTHGSLRLSTDGFFTDPFEYAGKLFEVSGGAARGLHFTGSNYFHSREDIVGWVNDGGDVHLNGYHEAKSIVGGDSAGRFIALSLEAKEELGVPQPSGQANYIKFLDWSQTESQTDRSPLFRTTGNVGRFGTEGLFMPTNAEAYDYDIGGFTSYGAKVKRAPRMPGDEHPFLYIDGAANLRASMDSGGRWQFGRGLLPAEGDLPSIFQVRNNGGHRLDVENTASSSVTGFRAINTAGNASFTVGTDGNGIVETNGIPRTVTTFANFRPNTDEQLDLGAADNRWRDVRATNGTIITSDEREKQQQREMSDAESRVAQALKKSGVFFKWNSAVESKGDDARWHFGWMAQSVVDAFLAEGLNANDYGILCYDEWDEKPEVLDKETGEIIREYRPSGNRYGLRYDQLVAFIISAM